MLGRDVPPAYTGALKAVQAAAGRLALSGCADDSAAGQLAGLAPLAIGVVAVIGLFNCVEAAGKLRGGGGGHAAAPGGWWPGPRRAG